MSNKPPACENSLIENANKIDSHSKIIISNNKNCLINNYQGAIDKSELICNNLE